MKKSIVIISFFFTLFDAFSSQIPVGIFTKSITIWRYWEKIDDNFQHKMIVFNTSESALIFTLRQEVLLDDQMNLDTNKNKIFLRPTKIKKADFIILDLPPRVEKQEFMIFMVNERRVGILGLLNLTPPEDLPAQKFSSNEGLNGRGGLFWITTNNYVGYQNKVSEIIFYFNYNERQPYSKDGLHVLYLRPERNKNIILSEINLNGQKIGFLNDKNEYEIEIPYTHKVTPKDKYELIISYKVKRTNKKQYYFGLNSSLGFYLNKDETANIRDEKNFAAGVGFSLPIIIN